MRCRGIDHERWGSILGTHGVELRFYAAHGLKLGFEAFVHGRELCFVFRLQTAHFGLCARVFCDESLPYPLQ